MYKLRTSPLTVSNLDHNLGFWCSSNLQFTGVTITLLQNNIWISDTVEIHFWQVMDVQVMGALGPV